MTIYTPTVAAHSKACDQLAALDVGYDQDQRMTFLLQDAKTGTYFFNPKPSETDCSASCAGISAVAGSKVNIPGIYTGNFQERMKAAGYKAINFKSISQVVEGDFLLGPGHVIYCRETGKRWWSAEADERGKAKGGKAGDQTGKEAYFRKPYQRSRNWEWILRPQPAPSKNPIVPAPAASRDFRLACWNIQVDNGSTYSPAARRKAQIQRLTHILNGSKTGRASIYGLVECSAAAHGELIKGLGSGFMGMNGGGRCSIIWDETKWARISSGSKQWDSNGHGYVAVELRDIATGKTLNVVITHIVNGTLKKATKLKQIAQLAALTRSWKDPTVIMGDFNLSSASIKLSGFSELRLKAKTKFKSGYRTRGGYKNGGSIIDHIYCKGLGLRGYAVLDGSVGHASDHNLLRANLTI
jgi:hypothetical protein